MPIFSSAALALLAACSRDDTELVLHQAEAAMSAARKDSSVGRWAQGERGMAAAIARVEGRKGAESRRRAWSAERAELASRIAGKSALDARWAAAGKADLRELQVLHADAEGWPVSWRKDLEALIARRRSEVPVRPPSFEAKRAELSASLGKQWSALKAAWTDYGRRTDVDAGDRRKAGEELKRLEIRAREDLRPILLRAGREEDAAARRAMLEQEAPRFRGMECEAELVAAMAKH